ncbi:MAG: crossover junction endodeoxyribonuclease RuvC [Peptostreptococcaceae bacterium]|nr:crossover junction endodeoxyribonuclease RuvC [Peptostreptococcaceae bacterium]
MRVLGIDPGLAIVGYGIVDFDGDRYTVVDYGVITTPAKTSYATRIKMLYDAMETLLSEYAIDEAAIEELFFNQNTKTAIDVAQARGALVLAVMNKDVELFEYTPLQVKQSVCGYGRADKRQVQDMVQRLLRLKTIPKPDDAADALAIAIGHCSTNRFSKMFKV